MFIPRSFPAAVVAILCLVSGAKAQDAVELKYQFQKDQPVVYRTTTDVSQAMQIAGQTFETKFVQTEVNSMSLVEVTKEGNFKLKHVNHQLSIKAELGPAGSYNYDSKSNEREKGTALSNELNPVYETLSGVEYYITLTPQGKVEKVEGYKEILENILKENPLAAQFTGGGNEQAVKDSLAELFFLLPEKPVKQGDAWEVPFEIDLPKVGKAKGKRDYKFEGTVTRDNVPIARISVNVNASFDFDLTMEGAKVSGHIGTDSSKGDVRFDTQKGEIESSNLEYTMSGTINASAGDRDVKTSIKQTQKRSTQRLSAVPE